jgi:hypothetical protein
MNDKLTIEDIRPHYYTVDDRFYSAKEIIEGNLDGEWIPYQEYKGICRRYVKLRNKILINDKRRK